MDPFLAFLLGAAMLGTLLVLVIGVVSFAVEFFSTPEFGTEIS